MFTGESDKKFVFGLLVGVGLGLATTLLFVAGRDSRRRAALLDRAKDVADKVTSIGRPPASWRERRTERDGRTQVARIERIRSAGF